MIDDGKRREAPAPRKPGDSRTQEQELAVVCAGFADLCQYFSQESMDLPSRIVEEVRVVSNLAVDERISRMKRLNQELMEYLNDAEPDAQVRQ